MGMFDQYRFAYEIRIGPPGELDPTTGKYRVEAPKSQSFSAVWDTGASGTVVVPKVVRAANLKSRGFRMSSGIDGVTRRRSIYPACIAMAVSQGIVLHHTEVLMLERDDQLGDIDVLIGMDIISAGETLIAKRHDGTVWLTYGEPNMIRQLIEDASDRKARAQVGGHHDHKHKI